MEPLKAYQIFMVKGDEMQLVYQTDNPRQAKRRFNEFKNVVKDPKSPFYRMAINLWDSIEGSMVGFLPGKSSVTERK